MSGTLLSNETKRNDQKGNEIFRTKTVVLSSVDDSKSWICHDIRKEEEKMIKIRLIRLLSDSKKYIIYQIAEQWLG